SREREPREGDPERRGRERVSPAERLVLREERDAAAPRGPEERAGREVERREEVRGAVEPLGERHRVAADPTENDRERVRDADVREAREEEPADGRALAQTASTCRTSGTSDRKTRSTPSVIVVEML